MSAPLHVPARFNFARDTFDVHARHPGRLALLWVDEGGRSERLTYGALAQASRETAAALGELGLPRGASVLILLPRLPEWWESLLACLRGGFVAAPGTVQLTARDLAERLPRAEIAAVIADEERAPRVDEALAACGHSVRAKLLVRRGASGFGGRPGWKLFERARAQGAAALGPDAPASADTSSGDPALLYFTSGTTGPPKMVLHSQASCGIGHTITARHWLGLRASDLHWNLSDTGWAKAAWSSFFAPFIAGAAVFAQQAARFDPRATLDALERHPITTLCGAPTNYRLLVREDLGARRFPHLRSCTAAGEPLDAETLAVWKGHTDITIRDGYGQTETVLCIGNAPNDAVEPGSMGRAAPGFQVAIVDAEGRVLPDGEEGEIALRVSPERPVGLFLGYWKDAAQDALCRRGDWYVTGDRARRDAQGRLWFVGRADDVIKSSGYRIGPFEVESVLVEHAAVVEAAVVGKPDRERGQIVKAFVVLDPGVAGDAALVEELQEHVRRRTAPYKYPREIEFVAELPKTVSGKIRRVELRARG